jgi:hypothetical protein
MVAEQVTGRLNAPGVVEAFERFDAEDRLVVGQQVVASNAINWALRDLAPREWEDIASYLFALVAREPLKSSPTYAGHRILFGYLANELRSFAASAGIPVGLEADLRAASTKAEEERIRMLILERQMGRDRYLDEIQQVEEMAHDNALATARRSQEEEPPIDEEPAAPATEPDDDLAFL